MNQRAANLVLWNHYTKVDYDGDKVASCNQCLKQFSYRTSITNLKVHLKAKHPRIYRSIATCFNSKKRVSNEDFDDTEQSLASCSSIPNASEEIEEKESFKFTCQSSKTKLWDYFSKLSGNRKIAKCSLCNKLFSFSTSSTNLKKHLKTKHLMHYKSLMANGEATFDNIIQDVHNVSPSSPTYILSVSENEEHYEDIETLDEEMIKPKANVIESLMELDDLSFSKIQKRPIGKRQIDTMLLKMISRKYLPISIVEDQDFREFVQALNPNYDLPTHKVISKKAIPFLYRRCFDEQIKLLQQEAVTVCITADSWTSIERDTFIGITAHYINSKFQFKSVFLKCSQINRHVKDNLALNLRETSIEWDIFNKINMCVTDDDPDMVDSINILGWTHCSCIGQKLNFILHQSLQLFNGIFIKIKEIVSYFTINNEAKEKLMEYQIWQGLAPLLTLLNSTETKWYSTYSMIERFVHMEDCVKATMTSLTINLPELSEDEWNILKQLRKVLRPFNEAIKELSSDNFVGASKAIAVVSGLKDVVEELLVKPEYDSTIKNMIACIKSLLDTGFRDLEYDDNLAICILLDPRYKESMFRNEDAANRAKSSIISEVINLMKKGNENTAIDQVKQDTQVGKDSDGEVSLWKRRNLVLEQRKSNSTQVIPALAQQEVESYLQDYLAHNNCDPYLWWKSGQHKFPNLAKLFKSKCNIVATSVPSERLFSKENYTPLERTTMSVKDIEQLVFLNFNLKNNDFERLVP